MRPELVISTELLAKIRSRDRLWGNLICDVMPGLVLARSLNTQDVPFLYPELHVEGAEGNTPLRIPFVRAEPPDDPGLLQLEPMEGLTTAHDVSGSQLVQPWLAASLKRAAKAGGLLVVGAKSVRFFLPRRLQDVPEPLWAGEEVARVPIELSRVGSDPQLDGLRAVVVGLGSLGSRVAELLAAAGAAELHLVDDDFIQRRNFRRHLCGVEYLGLPKVDAVASELRRRGFDTDLHLYPVAVHRERADDIREIIAGADLAMCCADHSTAQQCVNHSAVATGTPVVVADVQAQGPPLAEIVCVPADSPDGCFSCWRIDLQRRDYSCAGTVSALTVTRLPTCPKLQACPSIN